MIVSRKKEWCSVEKKKKPFKIHCDNIGTFWIKLPAQVVVDLGLFNTSDGKTSAYTEDTVSAKTMKEVKEKYQQTIQRWREYNMTSERTIIFSFNVDKPNPRFDDPNRAMQGFRFFWTVVEVYQHDNQEWAKWAEIGQEFKTGWGANGSDWKTKYRRIKHTEERQQVFEELEARVDSMCEFLLNFESSSNLEDMMDTGKLFGLMLNQTNE